MTKHFGGRDAPFEYRNPDDLSPDAVPLNRVSVRYLQEQSGEEPARRPRLTRQADARRQPRRARIDMADVG